MYKICTNYVQIMYNKYPIVKKKQKKKNWKNY